MARNVYTAADHQKAFDVWYETRNNSAAVRAVGATWATVRRWMEPDFYCAYGCPWHGYEKLLEERDRAHAAKRSLLEAGVLDPVAHEKAMRAAVKGEEFVLEKAPDVELPEPTPTPSRGHMLDKRVRAITNVVRSDIERMAQWEYLWSKVYFDATGIAVEWRDFSGFQVDPEVEARLRDSLRQGLHATSLEQCVRMLKVIQGEIDALQGSKRAQRVEEQDPERPVTIDELRQMRSLIKRTPPSKLGTMLTVLKADDEDVDTAAG